MAGSPVTKKVTVANLLAGAGGGGDIFEKFTDYMNYYSKDYGWTQYIPGSGTIMYKGSKVRLQTTDILNDYVHLMTGNAFKVCTTGKLYRIEFNVCYCKTVTDVVVYLWAGAAEVPPDVAGCKHVGFKFSSADLYATNSDGTTETAADTTVNISTGNANRRWRIDFTAGTDCKYYVDGVLKNTITTNLPTQSHINDSRVIYYIKNTDTATYRIIDLRRALIEAEY